MSKIDRIPHQAARTYVQTTDSARATAAYSSARATTRSALPGGRRQTPDSVELSDAARSLVAARRAVDAAPDVRTDKVEAIKKQIAAGTYEVSAQALARSLLTAHD